MANILVVDEYENVRKLTILNLSEPDYEIFECDNAWNYGTQKKFDFKIIDLLIVDFHEPDEGDGDIISNLDKLNEKIKEGRYKKRIEELAKLKTMFNFQVIIFSYPEEQIKFWKLEEYMKIIKPIFVEKSTDYKILKQTIKKCLYKNPQS